MTPFQKVHQTYTRTNLWMQLCDKLKPPCYPIPKQLGEDQLARLVRTGNVNRFYVPLCTS